MISSVDGCSRVQHHPFTLTNAADLPIDHTSKITKISLNKCIMKSPLQTVDHFDQAWPKCRHFANILKVIFKTENIYDSNFRAVCFAGSNWQYPFIQWTGAEQPTCHHTIHWWHSSLAYDKHYNHGYHSLIPYPSPSASFSYQWPSLTYWTLSVHITDWWRTDNMPLHDPMMTQYTGIW